MFRRGAYQPEIPPEVQRQAEINYQKQQRAQRPSRLAQLGQITLRRLREERRHEEQYGPIPKLTSLPALTRQGKGTYLNYMQVNDNPITLICWECDDPMLCFFVQDGVPVCKECAS